MRTPRNRDIYTEAPLGDLRSAQSQVLLPLLQRCAGSHGLLLAAGGAEPPPALPFLAHWVRLRVEGTRYAGDLIGATDEPLPFVDDAFGLVWLRHALEVTHGPEEVLQEAIRMLAPGGTLVVSGLHPLSAWAPWFYWQTRRAGHRLHPPGHLARGLRRSGLEVVDIRRLGCAWPHPGKTTWTTLQPFGGGYVLIARKQRCVVTPLQVPAKLLHVSASSRLSPSARRSATA